MHCEICGILEVLMVIKFGMAMCESCADKIDQDMAEIAAAERKRFFEQEQKEWEEYITSLEYAI